MRRPLCLSVAGGAESAALPREMGGSVEDAVVFRARRVDDSRERRVDRCREGEGEAVDEAGRSLRSTAPRLP